MRNINIKKIILIFLAIIMITYMSVRVYHSKRFVLERNTLDIKSTYPNLKALGYFDSDIEPIWIFCDDEGFVSIELHKKYWGYLSIIGVVGSKEAMDNDGYILWQEQQEMKHKAPNYIIVGQVDLKRINSIELQIGQQVYKPVVDQKSGFWSYYLENNVVGDVTSYGVITKYNDELIDYREQELR